ncbi:MAG: hypothetical protein LUF29_05105 [Oscillospiraceae bacterium]|nr:hypothetical protein [Oscillospiraceae bacterium]
MKKVTVIPTLKFSSEYFRCPVRGCYWVYPGPLLIKGDYAPSMVCGNCGHVGLERIK